MKKIMTSRWRVPVVAACRALLACLGALATGLSAQTGAQGSAPPSAFARSNLHAWAYEEYDAVQRTPAERAAVLETLGLTRAGYVGRNVERMKEFDAYVEAYREHQIELVAVWTPVHTDAPLHEPHIRMFLDAVERHQLRVQWWVTLEQYAKVSDEQAVDRAAALLRPLLAESVKRGLRLSIYGHGRDSWFTQPENEIAIVERLRAAAPGSPVGIAYNFHHAHSQLDRFAAMLPKMSPYLTAINLNGMKAEGPMILRINEGTREQEMIAAIHRSGFRGPVGLLHHDRKMDAAVVLRENMEGLRAILKAIGDSAGASTY
jgi:sugar phosphate isomerase/epimerase